MLKINLCRELFQIVQNKSIQDKSTTTIELSVNDIGLIGEHITSCEICKNEFNRLKSIPIFGNFINKTEVN